MDLASNSGARKTGFSLVGLLVVVFGAALTIAACGTDDTEGAGSDTDGVEGRTFWSASVTEGGTERELVEGTRVTINFDEGSGLGANAGCNSIGGGYRIEDSVLAVDDIAWTEIGCTPELHAQDDFVIRVLQASPTLNLDGDQLVLETADARIELLDASVANPDQAIVGPAWEVTGFLDGEVAQTFAVDRPATVTFPSSSSMVVFDGCGEFSMPVEIADGSVGGPVEGDGELQFAPLTDPGNDDCPDAEYSEAVRNILNGQAFYTIEGSNLTITNRSGTALLLSAQ